jgi:hypothetical protein
MDFSQGAGQSTGSDTIPNGQLAWAVLTVRAVKPSLAGGQYLDVELTIDDEQPYARRKVWEMIGDPKFAGNSEAYRTMGEVAISRILEAGNNAGPANMAGYHIDRYEQLSGLRVPIRIGVEKGRPGYDAKNRVSEWLTPNPQSSSGYADFQLLASGVFNKLGTAAPAKAPATSSGFGGAVPGNAATTQTSFLNPAAATTAPAAAGSSGTGFAATTTATSPSPSDVEKPNNWLTQANQ